MASALLHRLSREHPWILSTKTDPADSSLSGLVVSFNVLFCRFSGCFSCVCCVVSWTTACFFSARFFLLAALRALLCFQVSFDFFVFSLGVASGSVSSSIFFFPFPTLACAYALVMAFRGTTISDSDKLDVPVDGILSR